MCLAYKNQRFSACVTEEVWSFILYVYTLYTDTSLNEMHNKIRFKHYPS